MSVEHRPEVPLGIQMTQRNFNRMVDGERSGYFKRRELSAAEVLIVAESPAAKDLRYFHLANFAVTINEGMTLIEDDRRRASRGLVRDIALDDGTRYRDMTSTLLAMRVDFVLADASPEGKEVYPLFRQVTEKFLSARLTGRKISEPIQAVADAWDNRTVADFYRQLYAHAEINSFGTWTPYEMELMKEFYAMRIEGGSGFTPFDIEVLEAKIDKVPAIELKAKMRKKTRIPFDAQTGNRHFDALRGVKTQGARARKFNT